MIEHWCHEINETIKNETGVLDLYLDDHHHEVCETYCETVVLFFMFGTPRAGYDMGQKIVDDLIVQDILYRLHIRNTLFKEDKWT